MRTKNGIKQLQVKQPKINKEELSTYVAKISKNLKSITTGNPEVLLRSIIQDDDTEFRDHCWVSLNKDLNKVLSSRYATNYGGSYVIQFKAKEKLYNYQNSGVMKRTLEHICDIKVLGKA